MVRPLAKAALTLAAVTVLPWAACETGGRYADARSNAIVADAPHVESAPDKAHNCVEIKTKDIPPYAGISINPVAETLTVSGTDREGVSTGITKLLLMRGTHSSSEVVDSEGYLFRWSESRNFKYDFSGDLERMGSASYFVEAYDRGGNVTKSRVSTVTSAEVELAQIKRERERAEWAAREKVIEDSPPKFREFMIDGRTGMARFSVIDGLYNNHLDVAGIENVIIYANGEPIRAFDPILTDGAEQAYRKAWKLPAQPGEKVNYQAIATDKTGNTTESDVICVNWT